MKIATIKKLLKQDPRTLTADQIGKICLCNYFCEETDRGSIVGLDDLSELIMGDNFERGKRIYLYLKMIASLRHMRLIMEKYYENAEKVLEMNMHVIHIISSSIVVRKDMDECKVMDSIVEHFKTNYPVLIESMKASKDELSIALSIILAYNKLLDIIKFSFKEELAEELKADVEEIDARLQVIRKHADALKLPAYLKDILFLHKVSDFSPLDSYIKLAEKIATKIENYNTLLPTGDMLRVLTEGYDEYIK